MEDSAGTVRERLGPDGIAEGSSIHEIGNLAVDQIAELGSIRHVVNDDDVDQSPVVQFLHNVRADKTGATGDNDHAGQIDIDSRIGSWAFFAIGNGDGDGLRSLIKRQVQREGKSSRSRRT